MKALLTFGTFSFIALLLTSCAATGDLSANVSARKERLLVEAGFKMKTASTPEQQTKLDALPRGQVSAVTYKGRLYYVYPASAANQGYVGRQKEYNTYKRLLAAEQTKMAPASVPKTQPTLIKETAGPDHIVVREFDGFGPLGVE